MSFLGVRLELDLARLEAGGTRVLDVHFALGGPQHRVACRGHIPGAPHLPLGRRWLPAERTRTSPVA